jgi:hypothetical protein
MSNEFCSTKMWPVLILLFALSCTFCRSQAQSAAISPDKEAEVTFYSNNITARGGLPGHQAGAFKGRLFDEDRQLAFMEPGHFITFKVPAGLHTFSATNWMAKHATNGAHVTLDLAAGEHYFIQALVLSTYLGSTTTYINKVTCEGAAQEAKHSKPLERNHLRPDGAPLAVAETAFPTCS